MLKNFRIYDWAYNPLRDDSGQIFSFYTFEQAWEYIYENFEEEDFEDFEVLESKQYNKLSMPDKPYF